MGLFRSEDMTLCSLYLQAETAYANIAELGELGIVHFRDLNANVQAFHRRFVSEVRRCDEMERQLRYFENEVTKEPGVRIHEPEIFPEAPAPRDLIDLEALFERLESEVKDFNNNITALKQNRAALKELQYVLSKTDDFFHEASILQGSFAPPSHHGMYTDEISAFQGQVAADLEMTSQASGSTVDASRLSYVTGVMLIERLQPFIRLLWFACRGNVLVRYSTVEQSLEDPLTASPVRKVVFVVFFQGEQLRQRVKKICDGFRATLYPCPESTRERREMAASIQQRLDDLQMVIIRSEDQKQLVIATLMRNLWTWKVKVTKVKAIYHVLNMLHSEGKNFVGECWLPTVDIGKVQMILNKSADGASAPSLLHPLQTNEVLPTYFRTNKFTHAFQHIVNAYGQANYKEMNPAPFGFITFPFLFGVMFGDIGHGILLFLFALWLVLYEKRLLAFASKEEMFSIIYGGRYIILLMGGFSIYAGFMYNEAFSIPLNIFGSSWKVVYDNTTMFARDSHMLDPADPKVYDGSPYPFGLDPAWNLATNTITFTNTYKEKLSVILGISQMFLGIILSIFNHLYFKQQLNIVCEFVPQVLFLLCMFGYLIILIVVKWIVYSPAESAIAPSLLIGYINMFLFNYGENNGSPLWYSGQKGLQIFLVLISAISAVWMLVAKPIVIKLRQNSSGRGLCVMVDAETNSMSSEFVTDDTAQILPEGVGSGEQPESAPEHHHAPHKEEHEDFSEVCIHQAIHTIEFCLGCISHTASYLRLWALSLAHTQLSEVLWTMVLRLGFNMSMPLGGFGLAVLFLPFSTLTVAILLCMEGLSAFLHTLRLHWVEFQSKFYKGEGFAFQPFSFKEILQHTEN